MQEKVTAQESIEKPKKKCLFIDDNRPIIEGVRALLSEYDNFVAVECHSVEDAINAINQVSPDVIFLDHNISNKGNDGFIIADKAMEINPKIKIFSTTTTPGVEDIYSKKGIGHIDKHDVEKMEEIIKS